MTSTKKIEANRQNALRSTGPRTRDGKLRVAQNAIGHGLLSRETLVPGEDPKALQSLAEAIRTGWQPQGPQEEFQVDLMIRAMWRLERLARVEAGIFARKYYWILAERAVDEARMCKVEAVEAMRENAQRIADPEGYEQAMRRAQQMTARGEEDSPTVGLAFIRGSSGADVFSKLHRYEAGIERSYYRALHELERLQRARLGEYVPPPLAVDLTVNGGAEGELANATRRGAPDAREGEGGLPEARREAEAQTDSYETNPKPKP
jgi:hypothetical protein